MKIRLEERFNPRILKCSYWLYNLCWVKMFMSYAIKICIFFLKYTSFCSLFFFICEFDVEYLALKKKHYDLSTTDKIV